MKNIVIRRATVGDASVIEAAIIMAMGEENARQYCGNACHEVFEELAGLEVSQYSYNNALVAEVDGIPAGAIVGYDGARLYELRAYTAEILYKHTGVVPSFDGDETVAGEFYLDSIGVLPEYRNCGIGRRLLVALRDKALSDGYGTLGLLVDFENPEAERLYTSLGFRRVGSKNLFGHKMWHLQYSSPQP